jgi:hypothetical protein
LVTPLNWQKSAGSLRTGDVWLFCKLCHQLPEISQ